MRKNWVRPSSSGTRRWKCDRGCPWTSGWIAGHLLAEGVISTFATAARKFSAASGAPISGVALDTTMSAKISGQNESIHSTPRNNEAITSGSEVMRAHEVVRAVAQNGN